MKLTNLKALWINKPLIRVYLLIFFLIPVPVGLFVTSFFFRLSLANQIKEEKLEVWSPRNEIEKIRSSFSENEEKDARANWEALRSDIPASYSDVLNWAKDLINIMSSKGFDVRYTLGQLETAHNEMKGFSLLPVSLSLGVGDADTYQKEDGSSGLGMFLDAIKTIIEKYNGINLNNITLSGLGNGVREINVDLKLWVGFEDETVNL